MTSWDWPGSAIVRVKDGDSVVAQLTRDVGFHGSLTFLQNLRLNRINCPPLSTVEGKAARDFVVETIALKTLHIVTTAPYKYGDEWMAEVVLPDGTNLSDELVAQGHAAYWDGTGPRPGG